MTNKHVNPGSIVTVTPPGCVIDDSYRERKQPEVCACDCKMNINGKCTAPCEKRRESKISSGTTKPNEEDGHSDMKLILYTNIRFNAMLEENKMRELKGQSPAYGEDAFNELADSLYAPSYKTWESCHNHFSCPNGEECWYLSEDYHKEHDKQVRKEERELMLKELWDKFSEAFGFASLAKGNPEDSFIPTLEPSEVSDILESLHKEQQQ